MANAVQSFIDSDLGSATATALHTLGALGFLAGAIGYLAWHRALRRGHDLGGLLRGSAFTTYLSIVVNLLGGFLRTYASDHPHLTQVADSPWVQVILAKHLFLFTAMGAAIALFERTAPRLRRAAAEGRLAGEPHRAHVAGATLVLTGIAVAAILGAVSQVVALVPAVPAQHPAPHDESQAFPFSGTLTGTPAMPAHGGGAFTVPANATSLRFELDAGGTPGLQATLTEPDGTAHALADPSTTVVEHPQPGAWRFELVAPAAAGTAWNAAAKVTVRVA